MLYNIWVTTACNLCCSYCYEGAHKQGINMNKETADQILKYMCSKVEKSSDKYTVVNYHGGEPLLNFKIIYYLTEELKKKFPSKTMLFGITTNSLLLDKEKSDYLIDNFFYNLSISIDGSKDIHDMNRKTNQGEGTYEDVVKKIKPILSKRKDVRARITYTPETVKNLYNSVENLINLGFRRIVPVPNYSDKNWSEKHAEILEEEIFKLFCRYGHQKEIYISLLNADFHIAKGRCNAGTGEINIDCEGRIYPCTCMVSDERYELGNVQKPQEQKAYKLLADSEKSKTECIGCGLEHWCIGVRCKLVNKMITGDFGVAPAFLCAETNAMYQAYRRFGGN